MPRYRKWTPPVFDPQMIEVLAGLDDQEPEDGVGLEDLPRGVRDAAEEDRQDRREWDGDLSE